MNCIMKKKPLSLFLASILVLTGLTGPSLASAADTKTEPVSVTTAPAATSTKIAFVGDTGADSSFQKVLNLIKAEGANLTVLLGDTSYDKNDDKKWDEMVRKTLGSNDPVLFVVGNHDIDDSHYATVRDLAQARLEKQSALKCASSYPSATSSSGMACQLNNVFIATSGVGTTGKQAEQEASLASNLNKAPAGAWRICAWHKNQTEMQVGGKRDETGWISYETCREKGAIIATGHEHSYSRSHLLSNMSKQTVDGTTSPYLLSNGKTIAFVSGLGGTEPRVQKRNGDWWAKIYTKTQDAKHGVLFGTFYDKHADFYFKNVNGEIIDSFTVNKGY